MNNLGTLLNTKTKKELIDIILELVEQGYIESKMFNYYFNAEKLSEVENNIVTTVTAKLPLTQTEKDYINKTQIKMANRKIGNILKGGNEFEKFILERTLKTAYEEIYKKYPRKVDQSGGYKAFAKLLSDKKFKDCSECVNYVFKKVVDYAKNCDECGTEQRFILLPSTFFNSKKYL